jgi:N-methylhydantoinase A
MTYKIGIDVGGTFTDLFLWSADGTIETFKTLSTPEDPSVGVLDGLRMIAASRGRDVAALAAEVSTIVHGTTVTTNATLTRKGAKTGLLTTRGVRDALEMRRGIREEQYDNRYRNVEPLVPRWLRRPVSGRLDYRGEELEPLAMDDVRDAIRVFDDAGVEAVAVCFMNSFVSSAHERAVVELVRAELPDVYVSASSSVLPTIRFYNRVSTTTLNAFVGPILRAYLSSLTDKLDEVGFGGVLLIMQSNGGVALPSVVRDRPATTLLSGPAGGPRAAAAYTRTRGGNDCVVVDMGGTSFDASLVRDGHAEIQNEGEIDRLRTALPSLSIATIGAGGGSIGWIDDGGLLRMGPQSAGALPGPVCYGRGGDRPTCTDANLVLGYLDPAFFAGGNLELDASAATDAIRSHIAEPLGYSVEDAAAGMYRVINANMAHGVREVTVKRGLDPREFPLVVAGGAGALHACMIATELEIPRLIVPSTASVLCAAGMLLSDLQHDFVRSLVCRLHDVDLARLRTVIDEMTGAGAQQLATEGIDESRTEHHSALDLRYVKQYHEVTVPLDAGALRAGDLSAVIAAFHDEHDRLYGYDLREQGTPLELINVRVRSVGRTDKPELPRIASGGPDATSALKGERRALAPESGEMVSMPVYDAHALKAGNVIRGPALVERSDTTILVAESFDAEIDPYGSCQLDMRRDG